MRERKPESSVEQRAFSEREAAAYLSVSRSFLAQGRMHGDREGRTPAPPYVKLGRTVRYLKDDLDAWLEEHRQPIKNTANGG